MDAGDFRESNAPLRFDIPEGCGEVYDASTGRAFYDLNLLARQMRVTYTEMAAQIVAFGTDEQCAQANGWLDTVDLITSFNNFLTEHNLTH